MKRSAANLFTMLCALVVLNAGALAQSTPAQNGTVPDAPKSQGAFAPTWGATLFANYMYSVKGTDGKYFTRFDLDRVYLTMKAPLSDEWKFQATTDIYRNAGTTSYYNGLDVRLKFAFVDYTPVTSLSVKFGMIPGPWNGLVETFWKYRGVAQTASDKFGLINTADLGLSASYVLPAKYGDVSFYMLNGTGYAAPEANRFKDYVLRATVCPFPNVDDLKGITLGGLGYFGSNGTTVALEKNRIGGFVGYNSPVVTLGSEYLVVKGAPTNPDTIVSGNLLSVFCELKSPFAGCASQFSLIGRFDVNEPNVNKGGDVTRFYVVGLVWKATDRVWWTIDHQEYLTESATQKATDGTMVNADVRWFLHAILIF
ncbi:MAG TPA: hypothetical protein VL221_13190 [Bacteroidota bacterium]|nr:hypothetical protein [Bacteroidota bacterium]